MNVTAAPPQRTSSAAPQSGVTAPKGSCCPLLLLIASGTVWFFLGLILALLASLKFHNPHFLSGDAFWTYGRVHAASQTSILYGFGAQTALAVGIWLLCRLGRAALVAPAVVLIGAALWNTAVTVGVVAILCGGGTGYEAFEMPRYVAAMLFAGYFLIAICGLLTFRNRAEEGLYPSQWFVIGSLFWFPWIFTTAAGMLMCMPVRGVLQASTAWWYAHNFSAIFLGFAGLASIFYFVPKLLGRPLHSYHLAVLAFWSLALFGSWGGIPQGAPLPYWIISMAVVGTVLTAVPLVAVGLNFFHTVRSDLEALDSHPSLRFVYVALIFWLVAGAQQIVSVLPNVSALTDYTWFGVAHWKVFHYGFFAFAVFGAIYYIVPRILDEANPPAWSSGLLKGHFWLTFFGLLISYIALLVAGVGEGFVLNDPMYQFIQVMKGTLMGLRVDTLGDLFVVVGTVLFLLNLALLVSRHCCRCWAEKMSQMRKERA